MESIILDTMDLPTFLSQSSHWIPAGIAPGNGIGAALPSSEVARWDEILTRVANLQKLGPDWDGMGAKTPSCGLVESAVALLHVLRQSGFRPPSRVGAGPDGEVLLEWQDQNTYLEAEVCKPG